LITAENFFDLTISVKPGYIGSMLELLQYLYLKNLGLLSNIPKILELCALLKMPQDFARASNVIVDHTDYHLDNCRLTSDFVNLVSVKIAERPEISQPGHIQKQHRFVGIISNTTNITINNTLEKKQGKSSYHKKLSLRGAAKKLRSNKMY
jgi:hypothetical protein